MAASGTQFWAWLLELILNLIPHKLLQGLLKSTTNDWELLPELVLNLILHKLELPDCVRFASLCTTWRVASKNAGNMQFPVPMLLLPGRDNRSYKITKSLLFSVQVNKSYHVQLPLDESMFRFCGSSHGWLVMVERDFSITLSSPSTKSPQRATIRLPPITNMDDRFEGQTRLLQEEIREFKHAFPQFCVRKVMLSANPTSTRDYVVVAIYGARKQLAILRSGDQDWTCLELSLGLFSDVAWHRNRLYAVTGQGILMQIDGVMSKNLSPSLVYSTNPDEKTYSTFYLVESSRGELLLVERHVNTTMQDQNGRPATSGFKVHRLEISPIEEKKIRHPKTWAVGEFLLMRVSEKANRVEVKEIGGDALFLGDNYSVAVAASEMSQCRRNCIYYTEDSVADEMGIFCLKNGEILTRYSAIPPQRALHPIWFTPILSDWI